MMFIESEKIDPILVSLLAVRIVVDCIGKMICVPDLGLGRVYGPELLATLRWPFA